MRQPTDAHRSLARHIAQTLPDYDVWVAKTEPQERRPYAVVRPVQIPTIVPVSKQITDVRQPYIVYLYPAVADSAEDAQVQRLKVDEALYQAFIVNDGKPFRVPFYDYTTGGPGGTAIAWNEPGPDLPMVTARDPQGNPAGYDYLRVTEYHISSVQDANDERRWSMTLQLRLDWRRRGTLLSGVPVATASVAANQPK